jgi:hypothetical protein
MRTDMHSIIEAFADTLTMLLLVLCMFVLIQIDPLLPLYWLIASGFMTWQHS